MLNGQMQTTIKQLVWATVPILGKHTNTLDKEVT